MSNDVKTDRQAQQSQPPVQQPSARRIPPRDPPGEADWRVSIRHTPLRLKTLVVKATSAKDAWAKCLAEAERQTTPELFRGEGREAGATRYQQAMEWLRQARRETPDGVEILGAEYHRARVNALRVKGTVSVDQIGFPELASV